MLFGALEEYRWSKKRNSCQKTRAALERLTKDQLAYAVNISRRYGYVYMDNPKTGCSSLKSALVQLEVKNLERQVHYYDWRVFHDRSVSPLARLDDLRKPTSLTELEQENYRFLTFVRNPYTRLLSCYRDKIMGNGEQKLKILQKLGRGEEPLDSFVSFSDFAKAVASQTDLEMNPHWRVQTSHILYGLVNYEFIGRFEQYDQDFIKLFNLLGINDQDIPETRHLNRTKTGTSEQCEEFYNPEVQELVYQRYRPDFENFGYAHDLPR